MNKQIDFTRLGGYPLDQNGLAFMQASYRSAFAAFTGLIGNLVIVQGVEVAGGNATPGWITVDGELMPFAGGPIGSGKFMVETVKTLLTYEDGISKDVLIEKTAKFSAQGTYNFSDLVRPDTIRSTWQRFDVKEIDCTNEYINENFDLSTGLGRNERTGWAICDGRNGTKNRGGRVSVGFSTITVDPGDGIWDAAYAVIGHTGGEKAHTLTRGELPKVNLVGAVDQAEVPPGGLGLFRRTLPGEDKTSRDAPDANASGVEPDETKVYPLPNMGSGLAHENRQPFIVSLFIMKL
jgi:hypothetical protein